MDDLQSLTARKEATEALILKIKSYPEEYKSELANQLVQVERSLMVINILITNLNQRLAEEALLAQTDADPDVANIRSKYGLELTKARTKEDYVKGELIYKDDKLTDEQKKYLLEVKGFDVSKLKPLALEPGDGELEDGK